MGMPGIEMPVDQGGLIGKVDLPHELRCYLAHLLVCVFIIGMKVQGKVNRFGLAAFVEDHLMPQSFELVIEGQLIVLLPVIESSQKPGLRLFKLLLVVKECLTGIP